MRPTFSTSRSSDSIRMPCDFSVTADQPVPQ